jgi:octaprenyl-diphosphate synthase
VLRAGDPELTEATYLEVIEGKTAELTRVSCELGARASGADATQVDALARYGRAVGIAFQIADDYLDVWGEDDEIGKTLGSDAAQGKATLPVIRTLQVGDREVRTRLLRCLGDGTADAATIRQVLETTDARDYTRDRARFFVDEATAALATLPPSDSRACLSRIAEFAVERKF